MLPGDTFTVSFDDAGIYPFSCSYHMGMSGAIVVGDGKGAGTGETISVEPLASAPAAAVTRVVADGDGTAGSVRSLGGNHRRPDRRRGHPRGQAVETGTGRDVICGSDGRLNPTCCIASSKSCRLDTASNAASVVIFPSLRRLSSDWSNVIIP